MTSNSILKLLFVACLFSYSDADALNEPQCFVPGVCSGNVISVGATYTKEDCLAECIQNPECLWFTFISLTGACELFSDCPLVDTGCSVCISGERTCDTSSVAFVVGNYKSREVEIYSPEGKCQHLLKNIESYGFLRPILAYIRGKILACGANPGSSMYCWSYNTQANTWTTISQPPLVNRFQKGAVYDGKLYIVDDDKPQVYDTATSKWSNWKKPTERFDSSPCFLTWKSTFLLIGGKNNTHNVQSYSHIDQNWTVLEESKVPMAIDNSACLVLPNDDVLVVGSDTFEDYYSAAIYNVVSNTWIKLPKTTHLKQGSSLVSLSNRIFSIGGLTDYIEEFHPSNNSWTPVSQKLIVPRIQHSTISLPASLFSHITDGCKGID